MPYRRLFVINDETINLLTQTFNRFYATKRLPETMVTTIYLFSFLGSALSPAISACVEYKHIVQRLQSLLYKDCMNTKLTVYYQNLVRDSSPAKSYILGTLTGVLSRLKGRIRTLALLIF